MKSRTNRVLSMILALVMVFSLVPASAFAEGEIGGTSEPGGLGGLGLTPASEFDAGRFYEELKGKDPDEIEAAYGALTKEQKAAVMAIATDPDNCFEQTFELGLANRDTTDTTWITVSGVFPELADAVATDILATYGPDFFEGIPGVDHTHQKLRLGYYIGVILFGEQYDIPQTAEITIKGSPDISAADAGKLEFYRVNEAAGAADKIDAVINGNGEASFAVTGSDFSYLAYEPKTYREKLIDHADAVLDPNGAEYKPLTTLQFSMSEETAAKEAYYAGDTLEYGIRYRLEAIPTWGKEAGLDSNQPLFDSYETDLEITLPAGLSLISVEDLSISDGEKDPVTGETKYKVHISATATEEVEPTMKVLIAGNGTENAVREIEGISVSMKTTLELMDRSTDPAKAVKEYVQENTVTLAPISTTTEDEWGVKKAADGVVIDRQSRTATVTYTVSAGLMRTNEDGSKSVIESVSDYKRNGRVPVKEMQFKEELTAKILDASGDPKGITLEPATITVQKTTGGTPAEIENGAEVTVLAADGSGLGLNNEPTEFKIYSDYDYVTGKDTSPVDYPVFTQYTVTAVYALTEEMLADYYESPNTIDFGNTATLDSYKLANMATTQGNAATATQSGELWLKEPAVLNISKTFRNYKGQEAAYKNSAYEQQYGEIAYVLSSSTAFDVYTYDTAAKTYTRLTAEGKVTSFPVNDDTAYYLEPGIAYTVGEDLTEAQSAVMQLDAEKCSDLTVTPEAGNSWTAGLYNVETKGDILIEKDDQTGVEVEGVTFVLLKKGTDEQYTEVYGTVTTDEDGEARFKAVPFGEYRLEERAEGMPAGYVKTWDGANFALNKSTVTEENEYTFTFEVENERTVGDICLNKYVGVAEANITTRATSAYEGKFILERSTDGTTWTQVTKDVYGNDITELAVNSNGQIPVRVAAKDGDGEVYTYRFKETEIPDGYYAPNGIYSTTGSLINDGELSEGAVYLRLDNRRNANIKVTKYFYELKSDGSIKNNTTPKTEVKLYSYALDAQGNRSLAVVRTGTGAESVSLGNSSSTWSSLPLYNAYGLIEYYIEESDTANYKLYNATTEIGGHKLVKVNTSNATTNALTVTTTLRNVEQIVPVTVGKKSSYTGGFVPGSFVTVKDSTGAVAVDARSGALLENVEIPESGLLFWLKPGQVYSFTESTVPADYEFESYESYNINTAGKKTAESADGTLDLTKGQNYGENNHYTAIGTITNRPHPIVRIAKTNAYRSDAVPATAEFSVYTKDGTDAYVPYPDEAGQLTIKGNNAGNVRLEPGTYYFKETTVPAGYLDPQDFPDEYAKIAGYVKDAQGNVYFERLIGNAEKSGTRDNIVNLEIPNIQNKADLQVLKYVDGSLTQVKGFRITVTGSELGEDGKPTTVVTGETDTSGQVRFTGLPIYDASGEKIEYTITEDLTDVQKKDYFKIGDGQVAELEASGLTTKDTEEETLIVKNGTVVKIRATKVFKDTWEFPYTWIVYLTGGAELGLYEKVTENGSVVWKYLETGKTDYFGSTEFTELRRDTTYAIVELSAPGRNVYPGNDPWSIKEYAADENGGAPQEITDAELSGYNCSIVESATLSDLSNSVFEAGWLTNHNWWVQFDITKWIDSNEDGALQTNGPDKEYDNAVFELYRTEITSGDSVEFPADGSGWEKVGTYTSGTAYGEDGERDPGRFMTDVDKNINENYVYMLVEKSAGPGGAVINDSYKYTFWQANGKNYSVSITGTDGTYTAREKYYTKNAINHDDILNNTAHGPGDGTMIASVRLAKWADEYDAAGQLKREYTPLPNAKFELRLTDEDGEHVIATMTSGLDTKTEKKPTEERPDGTVANRAWAQSGVFTLEYSEEMGTGTLTDYENSATYTNVPVEILSAEGALPVVYGVKVQLFEVSAPQDYGYSLLGCDMYLCFADFTTAGGTGKWVFNDAYFVKNGGTEAQGNLVDENGNPIILAEKQSGAAWYITDAKNETQHLGTDRIRIVDYPTGNTPVMVRKYGYEPIPGETGTVGKSSDELDGMQIAREPLAGVTMKLQKKNEAGEWEDCNYLEGQTESSFITEEDGTFRFPDGLIMGEYRIFETDLGENAAAYENAYPSASAGRVFTVGGEPMEVSMYNPEKVDLKIVKKGPAGEVIPGTVFTLTAKDRGATVTGTTKADGTYTFENITSGKYNLSENSSLNNKGYSVNYLTEYLTKIGHAALAGNTGELIGYEYGTKDICVKDSEGKDVRIGTDVVISKVGFNDTEIDLTVVNPKLVGYSIEKQDEQVPETKLQGAKFQVYYKKFANWDGTTTISNAGSSWSGWTSKGTVTTNANGTAGASKVAPGIYAVYETEAPAGYDILKDVSGNKIVYYIVNTGGLNVKVEGLPEEATVMLPDGKTTKTVTTLYTDKANPGQTVKVEAENRSKVKINVTKTVGSGQKDASELTWEVTFTLYDKATGGTAVGTATVTNATTGSVSFKSGSNAKILSLGGTYYLEESMSDDYVLTSIRQGSETLEKIEGTNRYPITVSALDDISVSAENRYRRGEVTFIKYDEDDENREKWLSEAKFEVRVNTGTAEEENWTALEGATVTEILDSGKGTGKYKADIPLVSTDPGVKVEYRIYETEAPEHYLLDAGEYISAELSWNENVKNYVLGEDETGAVRYDVDLAMPNTRGDKITVVKYGNIEAASKKTEVTSEVKFLLVKWNEAKSEWEPVGREQEVKAGGISYLVEPGSTYGIVEYTKGSSFINLDKVIYSSGDTEETRQRNELVPSSQKYKEGDREYDVYSMGLLGLRHSDVTIEAYNNPKLKLKVVKEDVGGYPSKVVPSANYAIYEIGDNFGAEAGIEAAVAAFLKKGTPAATGSTTKKQGQTSWNEWTERDGTKRYLVVETEVSSLENGPYDTLNKDDKRVVWYGIAEKVADPDPEKAETITLKNVYGDASVTLEKTGTAQVSSLLLGDQTVEYTLKPTVTSSNQALSSFVLKDNGLDFTHNSYTEEGGKYETPEYSITRLTIGASTHNFNYFKEEKVTEAVSNTITAVVRFYKADGTTLLDTVEINATAGGEIGYADIPANAASFSIEYICKGLNTATAGDYSLGYDFTPGDVTVKMTVKQQKDGTEPEPIAELAKIENTADVELKYPKWKADGRGTGEQTKTAEASAVTSVTSVERPRIAVNKTSKPETYVKPGDSVRYTIEVKNLGKDGGGPDVPFYNPIVLDMLPSGVTYDPNGTVTVSEGFTSATPIRYTGGSLEEIEVPEGEEASAIGNKETAVLFNLTGTLQPGTSVKVSFDAIVSDTVFLYGTTVENDVYASTAEHGFHTIDNPHAYTFENDVGAFADKLEDAAAKLGTTADKREEALHTAVGSYADVEYVWVDTKNRLELTTSSGVTLTKAVSGNLDLDSGFHEEGEFLGSATRTNSTPGRETDGWVDYRLTVFNGGKNSMKDCVIGDILPRKNGADGRGSAWDAIMSGITTVQVNGVPENRYTVYYYTGTDAAGDSGKLSAAMTTHDEASLGAAGWSTSADMNEVTAFLVVFNNAVEIASKNYIVLTYRTLTEDITDDDDFFDRAAFENSENTFLFTGSRLTKPLESNLVSVALLDRNVDVGGDVWIDEDWDDTQGNTSGRKLAEDYKDYEIVKQLAKLEMSIIDNRKVSGGSPAGPDKDGEYDGIGDSIVHFHFGNLNVAAYVEGKADPYVNETLNPAALKTKDPFNYYLTAKLDDPEGIFSLTGLGKGHYMSDDPDTLGSGANALDNNFWEEIDGSYMAKPFYLRYSNLPDNSKDIGFRMLRDLEIEKTDSARNTRIEGVKFKIYGPFDEGMATVEGCVEGEELAFTAVTAEDGSVSYSLDPNGEVMELVTGEDGKILVTGLNWWKEYVIEETEAAKGYTISSAKASSAEEGTVVTALEKSGYWVLNLPEKTKTTRTEKVKIKNAPLGEIKIRKNLSSRRMLDDEPGNTTEMNTLFIFDVKAVFDGRTVYSDVLSLNYTGPGTDELTIKNLPVGAEVTVTEIYAGNEYSCSGGDTQTLTVPDPDDPEQAEAVFDFTNSFNRRLTVSGGVVNHYAKNENGGWTWDENIRDGNNGMVIEAMPAEEAENVPAEEDEGPEIPA